jgi:hypothetical protein
LYYQMDPSRQLGQLHHNVSSQQWCVPQAPMCLLSPQHMAQHTMFESDGFTCYGKFRILTFSGFHHMIPYNSMNNFPIIFFATYTISIDSSDTCHFTA